VLDRGSIAHVATSAELLEDSEGSEEKQGLIRYLGIRRPPEERDRRIGVAWRAALERHRSVMSHS
jgi:hypothetical protein